MQSMSPEGLVERLEWRYAVKRFDPAKPVPDEAWAALERALVLAPSSFGLQPWRFVSVEDPALRLRLREVSHGQPQIVDAPRMVVLAARKSLGPEDVRRYIARIAEVRGVPVASLDGFRDSMLGFLKRPGLDVDAWSARQTYIALGVFLASAAVLGLDACPMEGIDPARYDEILGLGPQGYRALSVVCVGHRAAADAYAGQRKVRFADDQVVVRA